VEREKRGKIAEDPVGVGEAFLLGESRRRKRGKVHKGDEKRPTKEDGIRRRRERKSIDIYSGTLSLPLIKLFGGGKRIKGRPLAPSISAKEESERD